MMTVPCIWILEMNLLGRRQEASKAANVSCVASNEVEKNASALAGLSVKGVDVSRVNVQSWKNSCHALCNFSQLSPCLLLRSNI